MYKKLMGNFEGSNQMHAKKLEPLTPTQVPYKKNWVYICTTLEPIPGFLMDF